MATKAEVIQKMIEPVIAALGYRLWGIEYLGQGRHTMLRIYLDKDGGINIEDCAEASRQISSILDVEDPIKDEYTLEVSSPGLDRMLFTPEQYRMYLNAKVKMRLAANVGGRRNFTGILQEVAGTGSEGGIEGKGEQVEIVMKLGEEVLKFPFHSIEKASLVVDE